MSSYAKKKMKQSDIVKKIRKLGYKVTVLTAHPANRGGITDTIIAINGFGFFVEIKIDRDHLSKLQDDFLNEVYLNSFCIHYDSKKNLYSRMFQKGFLGPYENPLINSILDKLNAL